MRKLALVSALALGLGLACMGDKDGDAPVDPPVTPPKTKVKIKAAKGFDDVSFTCCGDAGIDAILGEYLDVQEGLASGTAPKGDVTALWAAAGRANAGGVEAAAAAIKDKDLATMRAGFDALSLEMKKLTLPHQGSGDRSVAWVYCPMENGGHWLQTGPAVSNPYYGAGSGMASCGTFQD